MAVRGVLIKLVKDQVPFPLHAQPHARSLLTHHSALVRLSADEQNEVGRFQAANHPQRPAFIRRRMVLVQYGIDPIGPKLVNEASHTIGVLLSVMAVTDKHFQWISHSVLLPSPVSAPLSRSPPGTGSRNAVADYWPDVA